MKYPSRVELLRMADDLERYLSSAHSRGAAEQLRSLVEQEEPKVETLQKAAERQWQNRDGTVVFAQQVHAEIAAVVLRRHLQLLELFIELLQRSRDSMPDMRERLQQEYREVVQMLEGTGE